MSADNFPDDFRKLRRIYLELLLRAEGGTMSLNERVDGTRDPGAPRDRGNEARELERGLGLLVRAWEHKLRNPGHRLKQGRETREAVLAREGQSSSEVAYFLGIHQSSVERHRRSAGRDPQYGERAQRAITAPAHEVLAQQEAAGG